MEITIEKQDSQINLFTKNLIEEVTQNVQMILISPKYSVPLDRDFGTSHKQLDTPVNVAQPKLIMEIVDAIEKYEPRVEITKINFKVDEAKAGKLIPVVGVKIKDE